MLSPASFTTGKMTSPPPPPAQRLTRFHPPKRRCRPTWKASCQTSPKAPLWVRTHGAAVGSLPVGCWEDVCAVPRASLNRQPRPLWRRRFGPVSRASASEQPDAARRPPCGLRSVFAGAVDRARVYRSAVERCWLRWCDVGAWDGVVPQSVRNLQALRRRRTYVAPVSLIIAFEEKVKSRGRERPILDKRSMTSCLNTVEGPWSRRRKHAAIDAGESFDGTLLFG